MASLNKMTNVGMPESVLYVLPENRISYREIGLKSDLFNKAVSILLMSALCFNMGSYQSE
jgi:hypothetical protein